MASGSGLVTASKRIDAYHSGADHGTSNDGGLRCWDCHDPHGDGSNVQMIGNFLLMAVRYLLRRRDDITSWMATGILVGMITLLLQSWLEWAFRQTYITVEFFLLAGFLAAMPRLERSMRRERRARKLQQAWQAQQRRPG